MAAYFVTGTDTGVGKTLVSAALLHAFGAAGKSCIGMKPVAAGREAGRWRDVDALGAASTLAAPRTLTNPYAFDPPIAPHIGAALAGTEIEIAPIVAAFQALGRMAQVLVVEGAGGFMLPLNASETGADLARALGAPVVLVVGMRLGCLNHALLTRDAIRQARVPCAGWVANCIEPDMAQLERNVACLEARLECPLLGRIPHRPAIAPRAAADFLDVRLLRD